MIWYADNGWWVPESKHTLAILCPLLGQSKP